MSRPGIEHGGKHHFVLERGTGWSLDRLQSLQRVGYDAAADDYVISVCHSAPILANCKMNRVRRLPQSPVILCVPCGCEVLETLYHRGHRGTRGKTYAQNDTVPVAPESVQRRVQSSRTGLEFYVALLAVGCGLAIPQARAAVHTFLAIEGGHFVFTASNRLSSAHLDAPLGFTGAAEVGTAQDHVI